VSRGGRDTKAVKKTNNEGRKSGCSNANEHDDEKRRTDTVPEKKANEDGRTETNP
jgi:hypothetical protein